MTRAKRIIWTDAAIGTLFIGNIFSLAANQGTGTQILRSVHPITGLLFLGGCLVHLSMHWSWVRAALLRPATSMPRNAQMKRVVAICMLSVIAFCGLTGVMDWLAPGDSRNHFPHNWNGLHHISGMSLIFLIIVHMSLHWNWIKHNVFRLLPEQQL